MVNLGAVVAQAMPLLRQTAESMMVDTCTVETITGVTTDQLTGADTPTYATVYGPEIAPYFGKCRVQDLDPQEANPEAGGATYTIQRYQVAVPVGSFAPAVHQVVTMVTAALDPNLVGVKFSVVALLHKTAATAYRLSVKEAV